MALNNLIFAYTDKTPLSQYRRWQQEMLVHPEKRVRYDYDVFMTEAQVLIYERQPRKAMPCSRKAVDYCQKHHLQPYQPCFFLWHDVGHLSSARPARLGPGRYQVAQPADSQGYGQYRCLLITTLRSLSDIYEPVDKNLALTCSSSKYLMLSDHVYNLNEFNSIRNALYFHV